MTHSIAAPTHGENTHSQPEAARGLDNWTALELSDEFRHDFVIHAHGRRPRREVRRVDQHQTCDVAGPARRVLVGSPAPDEASSEDCGRPSMCTSWVIQSRGGQLRRRSERTVGGQPEQHPLGHLDLAGPTAARLAARAGVQAREHGVDAQASPQRVEGERAAERARLAERQLRARTRGLRVGWIEQPGQRPDQPLIASRSSWSARPNP
jgi:hypothetical protein